MQVVTIRSRKDGIVELAPKHQPADSSDRLMVIGTVLLASAGLFVCGMMPGEVLVALAAISLAGEIVLGLRALALRLFHPAAEVLELAHCRAHRR
jgi:hypothetical protein